MTPLASLRKRSTGSRRPAAGSARAPFSHVRTGFDRELPATGRADISPWRWWVAGPAAMTAAGLVGLWSPTLILALAPLPFVISAVWVGLPHGAADLAVGWSEARRRGWSTRRGLAVLGGYLATVLATLVLMVAAPHVALILFAVASVVHFGEADIRDAREAGLRRHGAPGESNAGWVDLMVDRLGGFARGSIILLIPLAAWPEATIAVAERFVATLGTTPNLAIAAVEASTPWLLAGAATLLGVFLARQLWRRRWAEVGVHLVETAVLVAAFWILEPLFAVGLYLLMWHALRHSRRVVERLAEGEPAGPVDRVVSRPSPLRPMRLLHRAAVPLLAPSLLLYAGIGWLLPGVVSLTDWAVLLIVLFAAVTPAHHLFVEGVMRRREPVSSSTDAGAIPGAPAEPDAAG